MQLASRLKKLQDQAAENNKTLRDLETQLKECQESQDVLVSPSTLRLTTASYGAEETLLLTTFQFFYWGCNFSKVGLRGEIYGKLSTLK